MGDSELEHLINNTKYINSPSPYGKRKKRRVKVIKPPSIWYNRETKEFDGLTEDIILAWVSKYSKIDITVEIQCALAWMIKQPYKPEYEGNKYFFLERWLKRSNDRW